MTTTRRKMASSAGLLAVVASMGVFARPSAPVGPDAKLISLCDEFVDVELAFQAIYDGPGAIIDDDAAETASTALGHRMNAILDDLATPRAVTAEGIAARARALAVHNGDFGFSFDEEDTMAGRLLTYLLWDAAAVGGRA